MIGGFERCAACGTMHGPVVACPGCGYVRMCAWCRSRVWIPGSGWTLAGVAAESDRVSHGICPWCVLRQHGGALVLLDLAAERLRVEPGYLHVRMRRLTTGRTWVRIGTDTHTGWAGVV